jgi:hypothetical protein
MLIVLFVFSIYIYITIRKAKRSVGIQRESIGLSCTAGRVSIKAGQVIKSTACFIYIAQPARQLIKNPFQLYFNISRFMKKHEFTPLDYSMIHYLLSHSSIEKKIDVVSHSVNTHFSIDINIDHSSLNRINRIFCKSYAKSFKYEKTRVSSPLF